MTGDKSQTNNVLRVGIIGEGRMGKSIFYSLLDHPFRLHWIASQEADLHAMQEQLERKLLRSLKTGILTREEMDERLSGTLISADPETVSVCDLVIEAIPEDLELKRKLFSELAEITPSGCILASNSSSIIPSGLFPGDHRNGDIIGIHYFYPVQMKETVELILTGKTEADVREKALTFLRNTNKQVLELNESNSFILNKLFLDIQNEAYRIVEMGKASVQQVDRLVKEHLFAIGIFDFMDEVGIDIMLCAVLNYTRDYPHRDYYSGLISKLELLLEDGKLGRKSGGGFYSYRDGGEVNAGINPLSAETEMEIQEHLRYTYLNAAKRFTMQSRCTIDEMNNAIREYLGLEKGPFE